MRDRLTFVLNGERECLAGFAPTTTLLQFLRREKRLTGTKEGCAEGDCGACTVLVGELRDGAMRHRAVNACILPLPMLEGRAVTTVEHVAEPCGGPLHPVQRAMVEAHGSQCGFCTPGIVMSLLAMYIGATGDMAADDVLAGNLCRCTGYGPIIGAAATMGRLAGPACDDPTFYGDDALLAAIAHQETLALEHEGRRFFSPASLPDLAALVTRHPEAHIVSGATDVGLWITKQHRELPTLIWTGRVGALRAIREEAGTLHIGAGVTWAELMPVLAQRLPDVAELIRRFGSAQVRNAATVGGNIANGSPIGDGPPALIALGARLILRAGERRRAIALEDFFLAHGRQDRQPGEFVEAVEVPLPADPHQLRCYKVSKRFDQDISAVCGCFNIAVRADTVVAARIAFGGMAAIPKRAMAVEAALIGLPWTLATVEAALPAFDADFAPISDMRASAAYRAQVARNLLIRAYHETQGAPATRLAGPRAAFA